MRPHLLIASPQMKDPFFEQTVVLVWHHDHEGAIGVVVNKALEHALPDILVVDEDVDLSTYEQTRVSWGGPVETTSGTVITTGEVQDHEGWTLPNGIGVTRSQDALERLVRENAPMMLCLGYAGWGAGQLDEELASGGWLFTDLDPALLFQVPPEERYETAMRSLGLSPQTVWMPPVDA